VEEIFSHEDRDRDGYISHDEFSGPKHDELWSEDFGGLFYAVFSAFFILLLAGNLDFC
jgi:hypothetical protein